MTDFETPTADPSESSAPLETAPPSPVETLDSLSPADRAAWRLDGKLPSERTPVDPDAPALDAKAAPSKPKTLDGRKAQIQSEIDELTRTKHQTARERDEAAAELAVLRAERAKYAPAPTAQPAAPTTLPQVNPADYGMPPEPQQAQYDDFNVYLREQARWAGALEARVLDSQNRQQQIVAQQQQAIAQREATFAADHADYHTAVGAAFARVQTAPNFLAVVTHLQHTDMGPAIAYELSRPESAETLREITSLPTPLALEALGEIKGRLKSTRTPTGASQKLATTVPDPPPTVGSKPALPADEIESAVSSGDFRRYRDAANRRALHAAR